MRSRSVSVTGVTGFLGWHIAEAFRDSGWAVRGVVRPDSLKPLPAGVERVEADLETDRLANVFAPSALVVHAAGQTRGAIRDPFDVNVSGTRAVIAAANRAGASIVHISSQAAAGPSGPSAISREDDIPRPITAYGRSKLEGERIVRAEASGRWTILRPSAVYGPRDLAFLTLFRHASRGRFPLAAAEGAAFTLVHVEDVAQAVVLAADPGTAAGQTLFIGHPEEATAADILRAVALAVGRPYRPIRLPSALLVGAAWAGEITWRLGRQPAFDLSRLAEFRARRFVCSTERASAAIGFTASVPLLEGMRSTWQWYRAQGWA